MLYAVGALSGSHWQQDQLLPHGDFLDGHLFAPDSLTTNLIIHTNQDGLDVCTPENIKMNKKLLFNSTYRFCACNPL